MKAKNLLSALALLIGIIPAGAETGFYRYYDADGVVHYVDDLDKIPPPYRDQHQSLQLEQDSRSEREKARVERRLQRLRQQLIDDADRRASTNRRTPRNSTPVNIVGNSVLVPVALGYRGKEMQASLLLDTGATTTVLDRRLGRRLGMKYIGQGKATLADGSTINTHIGRLDYIRIGPATIEKAYVTLIDNKDGNHQRGLLGMDVLRLLNYSIDFDNEVIRWHNR